MEQKLIELYEHALTASNALDKWNTDSAIEEIAKAEMSRLVGFAMALGTKTSI